MGSCEGVPTTGPRGSRWRRRSLGLVTAAVILLALPLSASGSTDQVTITMLATNDFHARLGPSTLYPTLGGAPYLATRLAEMRASHPDALYVDAGDLTGSGGGRWTQDRTFDEPVVEIMNMLGLDVTTVGNHEFDQGKEHLLRLRTGGCFEDDCAYRHEEPYLGADFTTLAANVIDDTSGQPLFAPWTIHHVKGVDVGFVGVTTIDPITSAGREGLTLLDPRDVVNDAVADVEAAGADVIVVLMHLGAWQNPPGVHSVDTNGCQSMSGPSWTFLPRMHPSVDAVVDGHTHEPYVCDVAGLPLLTQARDRNAAFTEIRLTVDTTTGDVVERMATNHDVVRASVVPDADVEAMIESYRASRSGRAPASADLDGDTLGDAYEALDRGTDPHDADTDGDGIEDGTEVYGWKAAGGLLIYDSDPLRADMDGGGADDGAEKAAGTNPRLSLDDWLAN